MTRRFEKDLSEPVAVPQQGIDRAVDVMQSGRLFRYGEFSGSGSEVAALEADFARYMGCRYAVAVNSGGAAMFIALKSAGVKTGDVVLVNAFTLAPVPGAVEHAGANAVLVECSDDCRVDLDDLAAKAAGGARVLLLSHMRGHIADMHRIQEICDSNDVLLIEDCAHTLGARYNGELSGSFGAAACFSLQSFKHVNAGEGGMLTTNDPDIAAQAILYSGSYMLYEQNGARPPLEVFEQYRYKLPNFSMRMHEVTAAIARPQLPLLEQRRRHWRRCYELIEKRLRESQGFDLPRRDVNEDFVPSSIQFSPADLSYEQIEYFIARCAEQGVDVKWFGATDPVGFTSKPVHWQYLHHHLALEKTSELLCRLCDLRLPQSLSDDDCEALAAVLVAAFEHALQRKIPASTGEP